MILRSAGHSYELVRTLKSEGGTLHGLWKTAGEQDPCLVHIVQADRQNLNREVLPFINELMENEAFTDLLEVFLSEGILCMVFEWKEGVALGDFLKERAPSKEQRFELGRQILERMLLMDLPLFLQAQELMAEEIIVGGEDASAFSIGFYYGFSDMERMIDTDQEEAALRLGELLGLLFEEEEKSGLYPEIKETKETLISMKEPSLMKRYQKYLLLTASVTQERTPPEEEKKAALSQKLQKKAVVFITIFKIVSGLAVFAAAAALLFSLWREKVQPVVESVWLVKTFQGQTESIKTYTGRVELLGEDGTLLFKGRLEDGRRTDYGTEYYRNGTLRYEGDFAGDLYDGQGALYGQNKNLLYEGGFLSGLFEGNGRLYDENGTLLYKGSFAQGEKEGAGTLTDSRGRIIYEGDFKGGLYEGTGALYQEDVLIYEGAFAAGRPDGEGVAYEKSMASKKGSFEKGIFAEGQGCLYDDKGRKRYEGEIKNGKPEGEGVGYEGDAVIYRGGYQNGEYEGEGKLYASDNGHLIYAGGFSRGSFDGQGLLYDASSNMPVYSGNFRLGFYDGEGLEYDPSGNLKYQGAFLMGVYNGYGVLYDPPTGKTAMEGEFRNGMLVTPKAELFPEPSENGEEAVEEGGQEETITEGGTVDNGETDSLVAAEKG